MFLCIVCFMCCFGRSITFNKLSLQEYNYEAIQKFADLYNKVVKNVIGTIKTSVETFKSLVTSFKNTNFDDIINNLIESVKQLPSKVFNLRRIGKRIYKAIGAFVDLPPVVATVKNLVTKVTTLFKDIKTDTMKLYSVSMILFHCRIHISYEICLSFLNAIINLKFKSKYY